MRVKESSSLGGVAGFLASLAVGLSIFLNSCTNIDSMPPGVESAAAARNLPVGDSSSPRSLDSPGDNALAASPEYFRRPSSRPGYATSWGPSLPSRMTYTSFRRENDTPHGGISSIYYNDKQGVDEMTGRDYYTSTGRKRAANGLVEWGMRSGFGILRNYHSRGKRYVVGRRNSKYSISLKNNSRSRLEVVVRWTDWTWLMESLPACGNVATFSLRNRPLRSGGGGQVRRRLRPSCFLRWSDPTLTSGMARPVMVESWGVRLLR
ncbi:MAG: hypothetical protein MK312_01600, partial [Roseibacillus sp.]|nr:hypothetical protein [Roseibacillus sp.]